ncbi:lysophospholipid acyltransferase family protein [Bacillota bacterium]
MNLLRNIPFLIWFWRFLGEIRPNKILIKKYRDEGNSEKEREEILKVENAWGEAQVKKVGIDLKVSRGEPLPEGAVVFVSNHQSYWDIPIYFAAIKEKQFGFVAKESLGKIPLFGSWIADIRSVFIKRDDARASLRAIEEGVELLKKGYSLVIFPEGTRSKGGEMGEFKKGSLRLAAKAGVPIVPVTLNGTYQAYEEKGYVRPAKIDFIIHSAIETNGLSRSELSDIAERVEGIIRGALAPVK